MTRPDREPQPKKPPLVINSEEDFEALMAKIDQEMIAENIGIPARPIMAGLRITSRYDITLELVDSKTPVIPGLFTPQQISIRIFHWMKKRYDQRLDLPFSIGRSIVPLRGALYSIRCPVVYGTVEFICEPATFGQRRPAIGVRSIPKCNVLDLVDHMTADLARSLNGVELVQIMAVHGAAMGAFMALDCIVDVQYVKEALGDIGAAVTHLMEHDPQNGLSRWGSLQAVEKLLKSFILTRGETPNRRRHNLKEIADHAVRLGLPTPPDQMLTDVQCSAGVRYGEISTTTDDALKAHLVSLELCRVIARSVGNTLNRHLPPDGETRVDGVPMSQYLKRLRKTDQ